MLLQRWLSETGTQPSNDPQGSHDVAVTPGPASYGPAPVTPRATASRPRSVATPRRLGSEFLHAQKKDDLVGSKLDQWPSFKPSFSLYNQASFTLTTVLKPSRNLVLCLYLYVFALGNCDCNYSIQLSNIDMSNHWNSTGFFCRGSLTFLFGCESATCNVTRFFLSFMGFTMLVHKTTIQWFQ